MREPIGARPVTVVVAAAGYGKTTAIREWLDGRPARWCSGALPADAGAGGEAFVVVERPASLPAEPPPGARLVLVDRSPVPGPVDAWRCRGAVTDVGPDDLALDPARTAEVMTGHGADEAAAVHDLTAGWPALVRLAARSLRRHPVGPPDLLASLAAPDGDIHRLVMGDLWSGLTPAMRRIAFDLAEVEWATPELVRTLGHRDAARLVRHLATIGVVRPVDATRVRVVPVVAAVLRANRPGSARRRIMATAANWYAAQRRPAESVRASVAAQDWGTCADLLARYGRELLSREPATVSWAVDSLAPESLDDGLRLLHAEALHVTGHIERSLSVYRSLAGDSGPVPAGLAWRYGMARYLHGEPDAGLDVLRRGADATDPDGALLRAWRAAAHWRLGEADACGRYANAAHDAARDLGDARALAAAHVALALHAQLTGDRPTIQAHYDRALTAAESAGDGFSVVRIRTNRASSLLHEARYAEALDMVGPAVALAEAAGYVALLAPALCNRGEALARLGRLDEAAASYEQAIALCQRLRTDKLAYALVGLGDLYRQRGHTSQARAAYEEGIRVASDAGDWQPTVRGLAGLARVLALTEPERADAHAQRALGLAPAPLRATALVAAGWAAAASAVAHASAGWGAARSIADEAAEAARRHRDRAGLAEALELAAHAADDPARARHLLTEAVGIWAEAGAELDADRVRVALTGRVEARLAAERLVEAGVSPAGVQPPSRRPAPTVDDGQSTVHDRVQLHTLGRFAVSVGGQPVPLAAWRSRKARDLLRALVARLGRAITRDELADLLWRGEPPDRVAHRLSVALSTVRTVLDPGRAVAADYFISGDTASLALNVDRLSIDAETFAEYARYGLTRLRSGRAREARAALSAAERAYAGDFLDDEPDDTHGAAAREQLRATFIQVTRALAGLARASGEPDEAVRCLLRLLGADPYDERAHRDLIDVLSGSGRHGEARRARNRFATAMREIGVDIRPVGARIVTA